MIVLPQIRQGSPSYIDIASLSAAFFVVKNPSLLISFHPFHPPLCGLVRAGRLGVSGGLSPPLREGAALRFEKPGNNFVTGRNDVF